MVEGEGGGGEAAGGENGSNGNQKHNSGGGEGVGGNGNQNNRIIPHGGGSESSGSGSGPGPNGTIIHDDGNNTAPSIPFTGAASPRNIRGLHLWGGSLGLIIAVGVTIAGVGVMMAD